MEDSVPREEIERRLHLFQEALAAEGLEGALILQVVDLYYLTGTAQNAHLVVPAEGEPALLVRKTIERARQESPLERIVPLRSLRDLPAALEAAGLRGGRLGLELDVLPAVRYLDYARRLEGFELADCSAPLRRLRAVKSAFELERIRRAAATLAGVAESVASVLREGMTEIELAAELEAWLRRQGHQGVVRVRGFNGEAHYGTIVAGPTGAVPGGMDTPLVGAGPNSAIGKGASSRPIGPGEPVIVDLVGTCEGYLADQTRTYSLGPLPALLRDAYHASHEILRRVAAEARPGIPASRLYELAHGLAGERQDHFMGSGAERVSFVGHGFGLELDEPPFLARGFGEPLEAGMVFALEPKFVFPGEGAVGVENSYAVTKDGVELLTTAPEELIEL